MGEGCPPHNCSHDIIVCIRSFVCSACVFEEVWGGDSFGHGYGTLAPFIRFMEFISKHCGGVARG